MKGVLTTLMQKYVDSINNNYAFICYRLPNNQEIMTVSGVSRFTTTQELNENTFIICPFTSSQKVLEISNNMPLQGIKLNNTKKWHVKHVEYHEINKKDYLKLVKKAIHEISCNHLSKVVVSRQIKIHLNTDFQPIEFFLKICSKYPNAFALMCSTPEYGTWFGASPELLVSSNNGHYEIFSLAGTFDESKMIFSESQKSKNEKEQEIVSKFIREKLLANNLSFIETGPEIFSAGNISHLKTVFHINNLEKKDICFACELHPTPAVCGYPFKEAYEFIINNETNQRELYGGFSGPYHSANNYNFFVNLRCMKLLENEAILYAGGGILGESDPELEWQETENKLNTLRSLIN